MGKKSRRASQPKRKEVPFVERPFEGLPAETDLVAMRDILPAATMSVQLGDEHIVLVTLLPEHLPALKQSDGTILVALQTPMRSGDASRDVMYALEEARQLAPGEALTLTNLPEPGARMQDAFAQAPLEINVASGFEFWLDPATQRTEQVEQALVAANEQMVPMAPVPAVRSAYWTRMGKEYLRWVRPEDEYLLLNALAKLHVAGQTELEEGVRMIGAFRTCGLLVPVWELAAGTEAEELTEACVAFEERLTQALADTAALTADERRARAGLISRQVNLR